MPKQDSIKTPLIRTVYEKISPWVTIQHRTICSAGGKEEIYHAFVQADYTSILALTAEKKAILVRQYRPAVDDYTIETPGGMAEADENLAEGICRELTEETGYFSQKTPVCLGRTRPDIGRLNNWMHGFFVEDTELDPHAKVELGIDCFVASAREICDMMNEGKINSIPHIWLLTQAALQGYWPELLNALTASNSEIS